MDRTIELNKEQKSLFEEAFKEVKEATNVAQNAIEEANMRRKTFEDLLSMYCLSNNLEKIKVKLDPQTWTILYEE